MTAGMVRFHRNIISFSSITCCCFWIVFWLSLKTFHELSAVDSKKFTITIIVPQRTMQLFKTMWSKQSALISGQKAMQRFYGKIYIDFKWVPWCHGSYQSRLCFSGRIKWGMQSAFMITYYKHFRRYAKMLMCLLMNHWALAVPGTIKLDKLVESELSKKAKRSRQSAFLI